MNTEKKQNISDGDVKQLQAGEVIAQARLIVSNAAQEKKKRGVPPARIQELNRIIYDAKMVIQSAQEIADLGGAGSGFFGHAGRDAENKRGGSVAKGKGGSAHGKKPQADAKNIKRVLEKTDVNKEKYPGISIKLKTGEEPKTGYALSLYPEHTQKVEKWETMSRNRKKEILRGYIKKNKAMLDTPGNNLGLWMDRDESSKTYGVMFIDVSMVVEDRATAWQMSHDANQLEMWDFAKGEGVNTGGTGEKPIPAIK